MDLICFWLIGFTEIKLSKLQLPLSSRYLGNFGACDNVLSLLVFRLWAWCWRAACVAQCSETTRTFALQSTSRVNISSTASRDAAACVSASAMATTSGGRRRAATARTSHAAQHARRRKARVNRAEIAARTAAGGTNTPRRRSRHRTGNRWRNGRRAIEVSSTRRHAAPDPCRIAFPPVRCGRAENRKVWRRRARQVTLSLSGYPRASENCLRVHVNCPMQTLQLQM